MSGRWKFMSSTRALYIGKSTIFKVFLLFGMGIISTVFVWYSLQVIDRLKQDTRAQVQKYVKLWQLVANSPTSGQELQFIFDEIIVKATFPIIVADDSREPIHWRNISDLPSDDTTSAAITRLRGMIAEMRADDREFPIFFGDTHVNYLYYGDPAVIKQLRIMPYVEIGIVLAFLVVGLIGFQSIRRSEERYIWVGMAKEAAHQLGTPISSLLGWVEVIGPDHRKELDSDTIMSLIDTTAVNMAADVERLQRVANRFGMIGSVPELTPSNVNDIIQETIEYYRHRLPFEGTGTQIEFSPEDLPKVALNNELFGWAIENLVKNGLQAVDSRKGIIRVSTCTVEDGKRILITVADNGTGISQPAARKIFRPGFTTKKRGWGMGLTLVKRIVEEYHNGRVTLKHSRPGDTVFEIELPAARSGKKKV